MFIRLEELDRLLGRSINAINLQDWESLTQYNGYKEKDRQITLFWKVRCIICVNAFNHELYVAVLLYILTIFSSCVLNFSWQHTISH